MLSKEEIFKREMVSAIIDLKNAVEQIELVCEDVIDCNDARLIEARCMIRCACNSIEEITQDDG